MDAYARHAERVAGSTLRWWVAVALAGVV